MVLQGFNTAFTLWLDKQRRIFFCQSGIVGYNDEAFELLFCAVWRFPDEGFVRVGVQF